MADIILVEDEEVLRRTLARALVKLGHRVREFETAEEALAVISGGPPALLFTAHRLPGMTGMELLARVHDSWPDVVIIMMTAYGSVEDAVKAMRDGASDYLRKPVDLHELAIVVNRCLDGAGVRRELKYYRERDLSAPEHNGILGASSAIA